MRVSLAQMVPLTVSDPVLRAEWVTVGARMAVLRLLEAEQASDQVLRYALQGDAAMRAGLDVLAPGSVVSHLVPAPLPALLGRRVLGVP